MAFIQLVCRPLLFLLLHNAVHPIKYSHRRLVLITPRSIQYNRFFGNKYTVESVYLLAEEIYFIVAIFLSHYVYRMFKSYSNGEGGMFFNNNNDNPGNGAALR